MNVLSLFDGISCGRVALERAGIQVDKYYASEIDKYAIKVSEKNYPGIIRLGDITKLKYSNGVLYDEYDENADEDAQLYNKAFAIKFDLVIGGSPCQNLSLAGNGTGLDGEKSKLFFEYVRILHEVNPRYFLLENVKMKKEYMDVISTHLGVEPICINSSLLSAQNRNRLYWTNIPNILQPEDKGIILKDIIEDAITDRDKSYCINANYWKGASYEQYIKKSRRQLVCSQVGVANIRGNDCIRRVYSVDAKCPTLTTMGGGHREPKIAVDGDTWRKLTPRECERLQTLPDDYTEGVSNTQRYKCLGNGWTVDIIAHILKNIKGGDINGNNINV